VLCVVIVIATESSSLKGECRGENQNDEQIQINNK
jgi:hypothetical protein